MIWTYRRLAAFVAFSVGVAVLVSLLVSFSLSREISKEIRDRETNLLFGAIESGPAGFARLQAGGIAQEQLDRLMENPSLRGRGLLGVEIKGGADQKYLISKWSADYSVPENCKAVQTRHFRYPDALYDIVATATFDSCFTLPEEDRISKTSLIAIALVCIFALLALAGASTPIIRSLRLASLAMNGNNDVVKQIAFMPIKNMVEAAMRTKVLERETALIHLARQVAHDIRSPLSALRMIVASMADQGEDRIKIIQSAIGRINDIAIDLLNSSKTGKSEVLIDNQQATNDVHLAATLEKILIEKEINNSQGIKLVRDWVSTVEVLVKGSESELARVFSNLLNNAIEAAGDSGVVTTSLRKYPTEVVLTIADSGSGMSPEVLANLGQKGFTLGKTGSESGNGLGVHHAFETIRAHRGRINYQSQVGVGTQVIIRLPTS